MRRTFALVVGMALALGAGGARAGDGGSGGALRWSRPIEASEGWSRAVLPDDVLAASRPGLPDLRVLGRDGAEVPYVFEQSLGDGAPERWVLRDVESVPARETTAIADRGSSPRLTGEATIELEAADFLKPAVLDTSDDGHTWKEIARGSIFATSPGARMTTLRFAPNDRRYWRLHLDDRNGPAVAPRAILTGAIVASAPAPRLLPLDVKRTGDASDGETSYAITLPGANLTLSSLTLAPSDAVFVRRVTVSERVLFRDEITRRVVGGAMISRGPSGESLVVPLGELRGPALELTIEDGASPPLAIARATATVAPRSILFYAPAASLPVSLAYGSSLLAAAHYDLGAALAQGRPDGVKAATLGSPVDRGAGAPVGLPPRGAVIDASGWQTKAAIDLPSLAPGGGVAYLPLEGVNPRAAVRIVDATSHEVPFLFERAAHRARESVQPVVVEAAGRTTATLANLAALGALDAITLTATAPDYFVREVSVVEEVRDARGPIGERVLGTATWERRPGEPAVPLVIAIATPSQPALSIRLENGANAPLTLGAVTLERDVRRLDFLCAPGDSLSLLTGDPSSARAITPSYDLALLAGALLALPAQPARLEPARDISPVRAPPATWFWVAVIVAGLGVAAALARALTRRA